MTISYQIVSRVPYIMTKKCVKFGCILGVKNRKNKGQGFIFVNPQTLQT